MCYLDVIEATFTVGVHEILVITVESQFFGSACHRNWQVAKYLFPDKVLWGLMLEHEGDSTEDICYWQAPWRSLPESLLPIQLFPCLLPGNILSVQGFCLTYRSAHAWLGFIACLSKAWHRPLTGEPCLMEIRGPNTKMAELLTSSLRKFHITGKEPPKVQV